MERQHFIDQLKAISIFLVVYGHNDGSTDFNEYLTTFRIPLFFALSGYVSKDKSGLDFFSFVAKISKRLLVPYFVISFFLYFIWFVQVWIDGFDCTYCDPLRNFIGIFYSQGGQGFMAWGVPMWFLTALFCVAIIDYFVSQIPFRYRIVLAILLPFLGVFLQEHIRYKLPWSLSIAMVTYFFYFAGVVLRRIDFIKLVSGKEIYAFIIGFGLHFILYRFNKPVDFFYGNFGFLPLLMVNGLLGFVWMFSLFKILPTFKAVTWIGRNTLPILTFHLLVLGLVFWLVYNVLFPGLEGNVFLFFIFSLLEIILLIPVIFFLNRFFPVVVGLPSRKSQNVIPQNIRIEVTG